MPRKEAVKAVTGHAVSDRLSARVWRSRWIIAVLVLAIVIACAGFGGFSAVTNAIASRALAHRDLKGANRWLARSEWLGRDDASTEMLRARLALKENRLDDVRNHLLRAHRLGASPDQLNREQWLAQAHAGQMREAGPHLSELLTDPRDDGPDICEAYATGYLRTYQIPQAKAVLDAWSADFPDDDQPHLFRARVLLEAHNLKGAEAEFRIAHDLAPDNTEALLGIAELLATQKNPDEALEWYRRIPASSERSINARIGQAECLAALGRPAEAHEILSKLAEANSDHPTILRNLGRLELEAGHSERAAELLRRSQKASPNDDETLYALASALRASGDVEEAQQLSTRVREIRQTTSEIIRLIGDLVQQPEDVETRYRLGILHFKNGATREGLTWLQSVLQFQPDHRGAREALLEHSKGREDESRPPM